MIQKNDSQGNPRFNGWHLMISLLALTSFLFAAVLVRPASAGDDDPPTDGEKYTPAEAMQLFLEDQEPAQDLEKLAFTPCVGGFAGAYPCSNIDLLAFMPIASIGNANTNDLWGWTDSGSGREFALIGMVNGLSFVEVTNPTAPVYLGRLPPHTANSTWRDVDVYANHAFVGSEASGHGMQVFALSQLLTVTNPPVVFSETAHYNGFGNSHTITINYTTGFAFAVGTGTCSGGLHMVNIQNPTSPTNAGCYSGDGYTHETQCVIYTGPDTQHQGKEICMASNVDTITIVDVTNKGAPVMISKTGYAGSGYTHQGWLTADQTYFLLDDELDEQNFGHNTRTRVWNVSNLDAPVIIGIFDGPTTAIDHNLYIKGNFSYHATYRAGLRILDITNVASGSLSEVAYFDVYPSSNSASFNGAWGNYPYFPSGVVIVSGIEQGLFVLQPNLGGGPTPTPGPTATPTATPPPPTNTGFLSPSTNAPVTSQSGDNNGYEVNPSNGHANDGIFAVDNNSGTNNNTSCTNVRKDRHIYYNYNINVPSGAIINGFEVRLDARADSTTGAPKLCVQFSWNGGLTWTTAKSTSTLTTSEATYILGSPTDTWGHLWATGELTNTNFRIRIVDVASNTSRDFSLDWVAVNIYYQP